MKMAKLKMFLLKDEKYSTEELKKSLIILPRKFPLEVYSYDEEYTKVYSGFLLADRKTIQLKSVLDYKSGESKIFDTMIAIEQEEDKMHDKIVNKYYQWKIKNNGLPIATLFKEDLQKICGLYS